MRPTTRRMNKYYHLDKVKNKLRPEYERALGVIVLNSSLKVVGNISLKARRRGNIRNDEEHIFAFNALILAAAEYVNPRGIRGARATLKTIKPLHISKGWARLNPGGNHPPHDCLLTTVLGNREEIIKKYPQIIELSENPNIRSVFIGGLWD